MRSPYRDDGDVRLYLGDCIEVMAEMLVTPPGGVVLDPFAGSGSTLVAARAEGVRCIGIEREAEYAEIIVQRLSQLSLLSDEEAA